MPSRRSAMGLFAAAVAGLPPRAAASSPLWEDQTAEFLDRCVPAEGFPDPLRGSLYFAGPSLWSLGGQELQHSFDGLGRLHRLYYDARRKSLCHSARFISSPGNKEVLQRCDMTSAGAFSPAKGSAWWSKLPALALLVANLDNAWVNQLHFAGRLELMTDTPDVVVADSKTLEATGKVHWKDSVPRTWLPAVLSTAHPIVHPTTGEAYNVLLDAGVLSNEVVLFKRRPASPDHREEVKRIPVGANMLIQHSWALSEEFAVVFAHPMFMDPVKAVFAGGMVDSFAELPQWQNYTRLLLAPLNGSAGAPVREFRAPPFMLVHAVNAYRDGGRLVVDVEGRPVPAESESFYSAFTMERVRNREAGRQYYEDNFNKRRYGVYRFDIPLDSPDLTALVEPRRLLPETLVFPLVSPRARGQRHCFIWATQGDVLTEDSTGLVKLSVCSDSGPRHWRLDGYKMVAEASFVPSAAPAASEDEGWLLVPLHEAETSRGVLAVLDASSMATVSLTRLMEGDVFNWCAHSTYVDEAEDIATPPVEKLLDTVREAVRRCNRSGKASDL